MADAVPSGCDGHCGQDSTTIACLDKRAQPRQRPEGRLMLCCTVLAICHLLRFTLLYSCRAFCSEESALQRYRKTVWHSRRQANPGRTAWSGEEASDTIIFEDEKGEGVLGD